MTQAESPELSAIPDDAAARLQAGAADRRDAMHAPTVATADGDLRVMVLRACDAGLTQLRFHTDARSPKVATVGADPHVALLAYDFTARIQIRASGIGRIAHHGPAADAAWAESSNFARRCYLAQAGPGAPLDAPCSGLPADVEGTEPSDARLAPARENFAVLLVELTTLDWLHLANDGHRRAQFGRPDGNAEWTGHWVVP